MTPRSHRPYSPIRINLSYSSSPSSLSLFILPLLVLMISSPPSTSSASCHFSDLPELVASLLLYLHQSSIASLAQTCRHLNAICNPAIYNSLDFYTKYNSEFNIFSSPSSLDALARNMVHVKDIRLGHVVTAFYYNCLWTYLVDSNSHHTQLYSPARPLTTDDQPHRILFQHGKDPTR